MPRAYLEALARLQDKVEPFAFDEVEKIVSSELGVRISKAFSGIRRHTPGGSVAPRGPRWRALDTCAPTLRLHYRRNDILRRTFVDAMPQPAVVNAVKKIDSQPNGEPPEETNPGFERQAAHKGKAHDHAQDWE